MHIYKYEIKSVRSLRKFNYNKNISGNKYEKVHYIHKANFKIGRKHLQIYIYIYYNELLYFKKLINHS